jgi:hypothetical protein
VALDLLLHARRTETLLVAGGDDLESVARVAAVLDRLEGDKREAGVRLLRELANVLER